VKFRPTPFTFLLKMYTWKPRLGMKASVKMVSYLLWGPVDHQAPLFEYSAACAYIRKFLLSTKLRNFSVKVRLYRQARDDDFRYMQEVELPCEEDGAINLEQLRRVFALTEACQVRSDNTE
jgi:hypothetical protein